MINFLKKYYSEIILVLVLVVGFCYRIYGLKANSSFWVDEASTARFGRSVLETGLPKIKLTGFSENAYYTTVYLTAASFKLLGTSEFTARIPEVVFGTLVILAVFLLGKEIFNKYVGLGASFLTAFSYIQIAWSRQARGYVILEFFFLLTLLFLWKFSVKKNLSLFLFLLIFLVLSFLTHYLGLILVPIALIYLFIYNPRLFLSKISLLTLISVLFLVFILLGREYVFNFLLETKLIDLIRQNFISYYHSLFWRQYPIFIFLSLISFLTWFLYKKLKIAGLFLITTGLYLFVISFLLRVPFEKYALVIFPIIFIISSSSLFDIAGYLTQKKTLQIFIFAILIGFILINGNKFSLKPKSFYTLNLDMREIPENDYQGFYNLVRAKMASVDEKKVAIVDISSDFASWYLGEGKQMFIPRNDYKESVKINSNTGAVIIHNFKDFMEVYQNYPYGFVVLVEHNFRFYPDGLVKFTRENLRLEKKNDFAWFSPDWNRWPVELYSWGFN